uniref:Secreted protein n=1 Tax=Setaria viridis TaxID=4556 RepID=A0A4U6VJM1_SETVI|nr:hypothetical protein SEVIR_3G275933v2 [Setaria viridis]
MVCSTSSPPLFLLTALALCAHRAMPPGAALPRAGSPPRQIHRHHQTNAVSPSPVLLILVFPTSTSPINIRVCVTFDWLILRHLPQLISCAIERS